MQFSKPHPERIMKGWLNRTNDTAAYNAAYNAVFSVFSSTTENLRNSIFSMGIHD